MPTSPPRLCAKCRRRFTTPRCPCHKPWEGSKRTGMTSTRRWRTIRANILAAQPLCSAPGCRELATELDHIVPVSQGGAVWDEENLAGLCTAHHAAKTAREAQEGRRRARGGSD